MQQQTNKKQAFFCRVSINRVYVRVFVCVRACVVLRVYNRACMRAFLFCVCGGMFVGWCKIVVVFNQIMFCLIGINHNILNHLVRLLPPGATTIDSFIAASMCYPYACHRSLGLR